MTWAIEGKKVLITGGTSGIGLATAEELARRGATVMITARDEAKGAAAVDRIRANTRIDVELGDLDLSRLESVRSFADRYQAEHDHLDVLVNNAGVMAGSRRETPDGLEWTFAVNHLGPFLLTNLLTDLLVASAPARIVNVSSETHRGVKAGLDVDDLQMTSGYSSSKAYAASKLANILFTVELERRLGPAGVTARTLHPGVVATEFGKGPDSPRTMGVAMTLLKPFLRKPSKGAATAVLLATADDDVLQAGLYWSDEAPEEPAPAALDPDASARLWAESEGLAGIT